MLVSCLGGLTEAKNFGQTVLTGWKTCVYSRTSPDGGNDVGDGKETQQGKTGLILNHNPSSSHRTA
jgi:hypothetical protein